MRMRKDSFSPPLLLSSREFPFKGRDVFLFPVERLSQRTHPKRCRSTPMPLAACAVYLECALHASSSLA